MKTFVARTRASQLTWSADVVKNARSHAQSCAWCVAAASDSSKARERKIDGSMDPACCTFYRASCVLRWITRQRCAASTSFYVIYA